MKEKFTPGTLVKFNTAFGVNPPPGKGENLARITDRKKSLDWLVPGYLGEGYYEVQRVCDNFLLIAHEDDLELAR